MATETVSVALYHATPVQYVPWILQEGLIPQWGPIARKQFENKRRVRFYASADGARAAVAENGDYRKLAVEVWGEDVQLCVLRAHMNPNDTFTFATLANDEVVELLCRIPAENLVVLSDQLEPVSEGDLQRIRAKYGPDACEPPITFPPKCYELPF